MSHKSTVKQPPTHTDQAHGVYVVSEHDVESLELKVDEYKYKYK